MLVCQTQGRQTQHRSLPSSKSPSCQFTSTTVRSSLALQSSTCRLFCVREHFSSPPSYSLSSLYKKPKKTIFHLFLLLFFGPLARPTNYEKTAVIQSATCAASAKGGCASSRLDHGLKFYVHGFALSMQTCTPKPPTTK